MSLIRGTSLQGFAELVAELGADLRPLLDLAHLPASAVGDHDSFVSYRSVVTVLEAAASATGSDDFGRRLATRQGLEILGPLGVAARTAGTAGAALQSIEQYMAVYSPAIAITVTAPPRARLAELEWRIVVRRPPPHRQAAELALGVAVRVFQLLAGPDFRPRSVQLRHQPLGDPAAYRTYFGAPVEFAADTYGFRFPAEILARPLADDGDVHDVVEQYLSRIAVPTASATADTVAELIRHMLPTGGLDLDLVAGQLALHRRTLQRQLAEQGTSFAALVDQVRRDEAERYLRETDMPLGQLAGVLGLSEHSALSRASRRWFGAPPKQVRRDARAVSRQVKN
ncbi:AraC family transcriptional regulator [Nocardioides sp. LHD-245]|uniref:AraC family transcriptional regulator n=1 Tax=Nocardioides sp. LHD-245 TaxID=3051387 RepID=UPI0027DFC82D|nr:AraC family transcriptional regulator [Nocardioides sp. LHD-245]